ncbi:hypothetical protein VAR608DRAFT_4903 [Variovorax sp. HW608]|uniref:hypothetical protein n=1 Tax=Variovorax sp. HW608 TaxID=1034889 RepID=UPI0008201FEC|nr:hypothetical protein [Variovorax sp. HW608]SCK49273.1 hypothetical protein VAR608DRAFT_4903 [Variovorax sp. HW608]
MAKQMNTVRKAPQFVPAILTLGAMKAHETRAALAILNGETTPDALAKYVELATQAAEFARAVHG